MLLPLLKFASGMHSLLVFPVKFMMSLSECPSQFQLADTLCREHHFKYNSGI